MTADEQTPVTRKALLGEIARLCTEEDLPVPFHIELNPVADGYIWIELRFMTTAQVDAWAARSGLTAELGRRLFPGTDTCRAWRPYRADAFYEAVPAAWGPRVSRLNLWCSVTEAGRSS